MHFPHNVSLVRIGVCPVLQYSTDKASLSARNTARRHTAVTPLSRSRHLVSTLSRKYNFHTVDFHEFSMNPLNVTQYVTFACQCRHGNSVCLSVRLSVTLVHATHMVELRHNVFVAVAVAVWFGWQAKAAQKIRNHYLQAAVNFRQKFQ